MAAGDYTMEHVAAAKKLYAEGLTFKQISEHVGAPDPTVRGWLLRGAVPRVVTGRYRSGVTCPRCGKPRNRTSNGDRCMACKMFDTLRANAVGGVEALQSWAREHGEPPSVEEWQGSGRRPLQTTLHTTFGSWSEAIRAAGLDAHERVGRNGKSPASRAFQERSRGAQSPQATSCRNGHPFVDGSWRTVSTTGQRRCVICERASAARYRAKRQAG